MRLEAVSEDDLVQKNPSAHGEILAGLRLGQIGFCSVAPLLGDRIECVSSHETNIMLTREGIEISEVLNSVQSVSSGFRPLPLAVFFRHRALERLTALHLNRGCCQAAWLGQ